MSIVELIRKKRDGLSLTRNETENLLRDYIGEKVEDYQVAAWLMAVYFKGMTEEEMVGLTMAIMESGRTLDFSHLDGPVADKHSTGGVGDKVSLVLAPILAACGIYVPMLSGRGLGHTGGTLDKLESIPGFRTIFDEESFRKLVERHGVAIVGQSSSLAPADRKLYALRDVTATVESIPLIVGSILGKKLAAGPENLVFDVKSGNGAFMKTFKDAEELASALVRVASGAGRKASALMTGMDQPLGRKAGNAPEVEEAIDALRGEGPDDLAEVTYALGREVLTLCRVADDSVQAGKMILEAVESGRALEKFREMVEAQGGEPRVVDDYGKVLPGWRFEERLEATSSGVITSMDTMAIGEALVGAGAGRMTINDEIDLSCGMRLDRSIGDLVVEGETIGVIGGAFSSRLVVAASKISNSIHISGTATAPPLESRILARITIDGTEDLRENL